MDKEVYELIDTALKIGLGAIIAGISAYLLSNSKFNNEAKKEARDSVRKLLSEAANKIEKARHKIEELNHPFWEHVIDGSGEGRNDSTKKCLVMRLEANAMPSEVSAISSLLGLSDLKSLMDEVGDELNEAYETIATHGAFESAEKLNAEKTLADEIFSKCLNNICRGLQKYLTSQGSNATSWLDALTRAAA